MKSLVFTDYLPPVTDEEIAKFKSAIGYDFPDEFVSIYKLYNGGQPQPSFVHDANNIYPINAFYSLEEIVESYNEFDDDSLPDNFKKYELLPFAYDPGSGIYSISLRESDLGRVYFYVLHEKAEIFGVWPSFKSFLDSIVEDQNP